MPSSHLILCHPLLLLPSVFPSIRVFSRESVLLIRWRKYWSFSFSISPSNEHSGLISSRMDWLDLLAVQGTLRVFTNTTVQKHQFFGAQLSSQSNSLVEVYKIFPLKRLNRDQYNSGFTYRSLPKVEGAYWALNEKFCRQKNIFKIKSRRYDPAVDCS